MSIRSDNGLVLSKWLANDCSVYWQINVSLQWVNTLNAGDAWQSHDHLIFIMEIPMYSERPSLYSKGALISPAAWLPHLWHPSDHLLNHIILLHFKSNVRSPVCHLYLTKQLRQLQMFSFVFSFSEIPFKLSNVKLLIHILNSLKILTKWSLQNFAHDTTAVLLCHVQNFVVISWPIIEL